MLKINNTFNCKVLLNCFFIINLITILGFFNSSWLSLIAWIIFFMCIYSANITLKRSRWKIIIFATILAIGVKGIIKTPYIEEGSNVFIGGNFENSIFKKKLPTAVFNHLNEDFIKKFPNNISAPSGYLFDNAVSKIRSRSAESRLIKSIDWDNRYALQLSAFNNTKYNAYGDQQPKRDLLPFFVKYTFPNEFKEKNSKLCWKGQAYLELYEIKNIFHKEKKCIFIEEYFHEKKNTFTVWFIETGLSPKLSVSFIPPKFIFFKNLLNKYSMFFLVTLICLVGYEQFKRFNILFFSFSFGISFMIMYFYQPIILQKFILFEGGNDGLLYVHFAHMIIDGIIQKDYLEAFRGGENAYDLMPFYRYFWTFNYILYDESPWIIFFTLTFLPLVLYNIAKNLLGKSWAFFLMFCWFFLPLFEAFGFYHFYYVKLAVRGFAEPLSNLFFFTAIALIINLYKTNASLVSNEKMIYFFFGLALSIALGLRANILPAFLITVFYLLIVLLKSKSYKSIFFLGVGLSLSLIMPIHNFVFTKKFIPLTIAAYKDWNLGASPSEYFMLIVSFLKFNIDFNLFKKITSHINGEIKLYEIWYHISIFVSLYISFSKNTDRMVKLISWLAVSMLSLILFYHVGGRYSYLTWTLCLFVLSYWLKNNVYTFLFKMRKKNAA